MKILSYFAVYLQVEGIISYGKDLFLPVVWFSFEWIHDDIPEKVLGFAKIQCLGWIKTTELTQQRILSGLCLEEKMYKSEMESLGKYSMLECL